MGRYSKTFKWLDKRMKNRDWSIKDGTDLYKFPYWLLNRIYSKTNMVIYHGRYTRGKIVYLYIPREWTIDRIPIIIDIRMELGDSSQRPYCMSYQELKQIFKNNKFED